MSTVKKYTPKKKMTRQKAINEFCKYCIYDPQPGNGTWRQQVEECTSKQCPLFEHRPITSTTKKALREKFLQE